jgi:hypothetical protein
MIGHDVELPVPFRDQKAALTLLAASNASSDFATYALVFALFVLVVASAAWLITWFFARRARKAFELRLGGWDLEERQARRWALLDLLYRSSDGRRRPLKPANLERQLAWSPRELGHFASELVSVGLVERVEAPWLHEFRIFWHGKTEADQRAITRERLSLSPQGIFAWEHCSGSDRPPTCLAREMSQRGAEIDLDLSGSRDAMVHVGDGPQVRVDRSPGATLTVSNETFDRDMASALAAVAAALDQTGALSPDEAARAAAWLELAREQGLRSDNRRLQKALSTLRELAVGAGGNALWDAAKLALTVALAHFPG